MATTNRNAGRFLFFAVGRMGPIFFDRLGRMIAPAAGRAKVWRVGFHPRRRRCSWRNRRPKAYLPSYRQHQRRGSSACAELFERSWDHRTRASYGRCPAHSCRSDCPWRARAASPCMCSKKGYLRPYWVTYERDGTNGNSALMTMSVDDMRHALEKCDLELPDPPAHWGDMRHHIFYGAIYHFCVMALNRRYPPVQTTSRPDRGAGISAVSETAYGQCRSPSLERRIASWRIRNGGFPYHLVLLQLAHDSSFRAHGPF